MGRRTGDMVVRVFGRPEAWPKEQAGSFERGGKTIHHTYKRDFRTRQVKQLDGSIEKQTHDRGYKMRWFNHVQAVVLQWMIDNDRLPFEMNHPIGLGCLFFIQKPKGCKLPFPTKTPDLDNLKYALPNILKRTPSRKKVGGVTLAVPIEGRFPQGVTFYEDSQQIWTAQPDGMLWATASNPPGVLITILDILDHPDVLTWGYKIDKEVCAEVVAEGLELGHGR